MPRSAPPLVTPYGTAAWTGQQLGHPLLQHHHGTPRRLERQHHSVRDATTSACATVAIACLCSMPSPISRARVRHRLSNLLFACVALCTLLKTVTAAVVLWRLGDQRCLLRSAMPSLPSLLAPDETTLATDYLLDCNEASARHSDDEHMALRPGGRFTGEALPLSALLRGWLMVGSWLLEYWLARSRPSYFPDLYRVSFSSSRRRLSVYRCTAACSRPALCGQVFVSTNIYSSVLERGKHLHGRTKERTRILGPSTPIRCRASHSSLPPTPRSWHCHFVLAYNALLTRLQIARSGRVLTEYRP